MTTLTQRGEEICYRLFDKGKSPMAVAHLMGISLKAARKRHGMWQATGGVNRPVLTSQPCRSANSTAAMATT